MGEEMSKPCDQPVRILVVDNDPTVTQTVVSYLQESNMSVVLAAGRHEMTRCLAENELSLVVLEVRLGEEDGLDLLRDIRSRSDLPVIITTGPRCDEMERVVGLELGADDCLAKPFGNRELLARIRAVLRRAESAPAAPRRTIVGGDWRRFGGWKLNRRTRRLVDADDVPIMLTKGEYALLIAFVDAPQQVLTREQLLQATHVHEDVFDRSVDVQILRLRRKLETDPSAPQVIQTERGVGYIFSLPVEMLGDEHRADARSLGDFPVPIDRYTPRPHDQDYVCNAAHAY